MESKIFYSWQSDLPNKTNRGFIEAALENAVKTISSDGSLQVVPVVDRDTLGVPGSPDISDTIFDKIEDAALFVADVSIINHGATRQTPNPNVLIELGYALKCHGPARIIMVMNTVFGTPEVLPFDLRMRRVLTYNSPEDAPERAPERRQLERGLQAALRAVLENEERRQKEAGKSFTPTAEEVEILLKTDDSDEGVIHYVKYDGGFQLLTDSHQLIEDGSSSRVVARWQDAFDHLLKLGLLKDNERNGERFHLSPEGFDAADQIRKHRSASELDYGDIETQMPELLDEMCQDLNTEPLIREFVILDTKGNVYNGDGVFIYYRETHEQLDPKLHILENLGLIGNFTHNNVDRYRFTEEFVKYLRKRKQKAKEEE